MNFTPTDLLKPTEQLSPKKALGERDRLRRELAKVQASLDGISVRGREIKAEVEATHARQAERRMEAARKGERTADDGERDRLAALEAEAEELTATVHAAKAVGKKIERELHYLQVQQFAAFAEHAETLGMEAVKALDALRTDYKNAIRQWNIAKAEWNVLVRAHNEGRSAGGGHHILPDGTVRTSDDAPPKLSQAPDCPLPAPGKVFGKVQPRPPEMKVDAE